MAILKTTKHILQNPWESNPLNTGTLPANVSATMKPIHRNFTIEEIELWEQLYYSPGFIGLYVAHKPLVEYYLVTYNLFLSDTEGYETFSGEHGVYKIKEKFRNLGISLQISNINY